MAAGAVYDYMCVHLLKPGIVTAETIGYGTSLNAPTFLIMGAEPAPAMGIAEHTTTMWAFQLQLGWVSQWFGPRRQRFAGGHRNVHEQL